MRIVKQWISPALKITTGNNNRKGSRCLVSIFIAPGLLPFCQPLQTHHFYFFTRHRPSANIGHILPPTFTARGIFRPIPALPLHIFLLPPPVHSWNKSQFGFMSLIAGLCWPANGTRKRKKAGMNGEGNGNGYREGWREARSRTAEDMSADADCNGCCCWRRG